jgi:hypothetical protein
MSEVTRPLSELNKAKSNFHDGCEDTECEICWKAHNFLDECLDVLTIEEGNDVDLLGRYHKWLSNNGKTPETAGGWWSEHALDSDNVIEFCEAFNAGKL